jgi:hypothetical protein
MGYHMHDRTQKVYIMLARAHIGGYAHFAWAYPPSCDGRIVAKDVASAVHPLYIRAPMHSQESAF